MVLALHDPGTRQGGYHVTSNITVGWKGRADGVHDDAADPARKSSRILLVWLVVERLLEPVLRWKVVGPDGDFEHV